MADAQPAPAGHDELREAGLQFTPRQLEQMHRYDVLALQWASEKIDRLREEVWALRSLIEETGTPEMRLTANKIRRVAP